MPISRRKLFRSLVATAGITAATTIPARESLAGIVGGDYARLFARRSAELSLTRKAVFFLGGAGTAAQQQSYGIFNVKAFNAVGNTIMLTDGAMSSSVNPTHLSSASASFVSGDVGKTVCVSGALSGGAPLVTTIASISSGTVAVLAASATATVSNAIVHYGKDDTAAFQAVVNAIFAAGGGVCYAPEGIYMIAGAFGGPGGQNAQIYLPFISSIASPQVSITFIGATHPIPSAPGGYVLSNAPPITTGTILFSPTNGTGTSPAVLGAGPLNINGSLPFNLSMPTVANITFRTAGQNPNPVIAVNFGSSTSAHLEAVYFDVDATTNTIAAAAPVLNSAAYIMPSLNNIGYNVVRDCWAMGYDQAFCWSEHGIMDNVDIFLCNIAFVIVPANHALHGTRVCPQSCKTGLDATLGSTTYLNIMQFDTEHNDTLTHWFNNPVDVQDGSNVLHGAINYVVVKSGVGVDQPDFNKTGGSNLICTAL